MSARRSVRATVPTDKIAARATIAIAQLLRELSRCDSGSDREKDVRGALFVLVSDPSSDHASSEIEGVRA